MLDKRTLLAKIIADLTAQKEELERSLEKIRRTVNEAPAPSESHSDTTRFQMSTVEQEVERSLADKQRTLQTLARFVSRAMTAERDRITIGSIVNLLEEGGKPVTYCILPAGGGIIVETAERAINVVTERAPLAQALLGHMIGELVCVKLPSGNRRFAITAVY